MFAVDRSNDVNCEIKSQSWEADEPMQVSEVINVCLHHTRTQAGRHRHTRTHTDRQTDTHTHTHRHRSHLCCVSMDSGILLLVLSCPYGIEINNPTCIVMIWFCIFVDVAANVLLVFLVWKQVKTRV